MGLANGQEPDDAGRLKDLKATPHPRGLEIELTWGNLHPNDYPKVRIIRRTGSYAQSETDGEALPEADIEVTVADNGEHDCTIRDRNLQGETIYYYRLFPYRSNPPEYWSAPDGADPENRTAAMATSCYDLGGQLYRWLPGIHHRYDADRESLRRFLELVGGELDQLYSLARALPELYDLNRVDGRLLPLLADWIGWPTDHRREIAGQRTEIRHAPYIYRTIGVIPSAEAAVKRTVGWGCRTKEFFHNVLFSNRPEQLNLWRTERGSGGAWTVAESPWSLDFAYEGRAAVVVHGEVGHGDVRWFFFHAWRRGRWEIRYKRQAGAAEEEPSRALNPGETVLERHPAAVSWNGWLWVFWDRCDGTGANGEIGYRVLGSADSGAWETAKTLRDGGRQPFRKSPSAVVDEHDRLWLFWLEREPAGWIQRFALCDSARDPDTGERVLVAGEVRSLPPTDAGPRPEGDVFALAVPHNGGQALCVFWTRHGDRGQSEIACRMKFSLDSGPAEDWGGLSTLPKPDPGDCNDREPAAIAAEPELIELFWSSDRTGSGSIWRCAGRLDPGRPGRIEWRPGVEEITRDPRSAPYTQRGPCPFLVDQNWALLYRSNQAVGYRSERYRATETWDFRYAGCTTVDARNRAKLAQRRKFEDFQCYTYDTGQTGLHSGGGQEGVRSELSWYARDTVGFYLTPGKTENWALIQQGRKLTERVLREFLPIQVRPVFIIELPIWEERVYDGRAIREEISSTLTLSTEETCPGAGEAGGWDKVPAEWSWIFSWSPLWWRRDSPHHRSVDFLASPIDTRYRTWQVGLHLERTEDSDPVYSEPRAPKDQTWFELRAGAEDRYAGITEEHTDRAPEWVWILSWSGDWWGHDPARHRTVDCTESDIRPRFRTWHTGLSAGG